MKKVIVITVVLVLAGIAVFMLRSQMSDERLSEAQVKEKFRCDRITADVLATDIYCRNPQYYYEDAKNGTVIDASDFDNPRYKAMYGN